MAATAGRRTHADRRSERPPRASPPLVMFWPFNLGPDEQAALDGMGVWDEMVLYDEESGNFCLNAFDPWRVLRYIDAIAWAHMDAHLRTIGMRLTYPDPCDCRPVCSQHG